MQIVGVWVVLIVAGRKLRPAGSCRAIIFDSTGTALLDVTAAAAIYERARREGRGTPFQLRSEPESLLTGNSRGGAA